MLESFAMTRLTITVLGGLNVQLTGADRPLDLPTRKSKAFLAYLALAPGMLRSREHLASVFWDRSAEEQARASLRQSLSSLRRALSSSSSLIIPIRIPCGSMRRHWKWTPCNSRRLAAERSGNLSNGPLRSTAVVLNGFSLRESTSSNG